MRPVTKAGVGDLMALGDGTQHIVAATYNPYQDAKAALVANLGRFCSYCEEAYHYDRDLHVEHVQPKGLPQYAHLETQWTNFLLGCATCNGADNKDTKDVVITDIHLPHLNNTYKSLVYMAGGVVVVNPTLTGDSQAHAQSLLELVGLNKTPANSKPGDKRCLKRGEDWKMADRYLKKYQAGKVDEDTILDLVTNRGGWSIWFTVFKGCDAVRERLINGIPGTCAACFDAANHYEPIDRNPWQVDPV